VSSWLSLSGRFAKAVGEVSPDVTVLELLVEEGKSGSFRSSESNSLEPLMGSSLDLDLTLEALDLSFKRER
jgi:hypothetical protein